MQKATPAILYFYVYALLHVDDALRDYNAIPCCSLCGTCKNTCFNFYPYYMNISNCSLSLIRILYCLLGPIPATLAQENWKIENVKGIGVGKGAHEKGIEKFKQIINKEHLSNPEKDCEKTLDKVFEDLGSQFQNLEPQVITITVLNTDSVDSTGNESTKEEELGKQEAERIAKKYMPK